MLSWPKHQEPEEWVCYRFKRTVVDPGAKILPHSRITVGFPGGSDGKESTCSAGDPGSISGSGKSPGEGSGYPLQYSSLENSMDRRAWLTTVNRVSKNWTWMSELTVQLIIFIACSQYLLASTWLTSQSSICSIHSFKAFLTGTPSASACKLLLELDHYLPAM